uniref:Putative secreted protein n=1 Tax=Anopheles darlingi TaxID=43151 RepID=A0A2M4DFB2_ANODA
MPYLEVPMGCWVLIVVAGVVAVALAAATTLLDRLSHTTRKVPALAVIGTNTVRVSHRRYAVIATLNHSTR